jgi:hypothetical protein
MKRISLDRFRIGAVLGTKDTLRGNENESNDKVNGPTSPNAADMRHRKLWFLPLKALNLETLKP